VSGFVLQNSMLEKSEKGKAAEKWRRKATGAKSVEGESRFWIIWDQIGSFAINTWGKIIYFAR
jgi:hypothetical protein